MLGCVGLLAAVMTGGTARAVAPRPAAIPTAGGELVTSKKIPTTPGTMENVREMFTVDMAGQSTPDVQITFRDGPDNGAAFSPDGSRLAWNYYADNTYCFVGSDIWMMTPYEQSSFTNVTGPVDPAPSSFEGGPAWSPDGKKVAFAVLPYYGCFGSFPDMSIAIYDFDTNTWTTVVTDDGPGTAFLGTPDWSPDGTKIAFSLQYDGDLTGQDIMLYDVASGPATTSTLTRLAQPGTQNNPDWSPDGSRLAVETNNNGSSSLGNFDMLRDGPADRQLRRAAGEQPLRRDRAGLVAGGLEAGVRVTEGVPVRRRVRHRRIRGLREEPRHG